MYDISHAATAFDKTCSKVGWTSKERDTVSYSCMIENNNIHQKDTPCLERVTHTLRRSALKILNIKGFSIYKVRVALVSGIIVRVLWELTLKLSI